MHTHWRLQFAENPITNVNRRSIAVSRNLAAEGVRKRNEQRGVRNGEPEAEVES